MSVYYEQDTVLVTANITDKPEMVLSEGAYPLAVEGRQVSMHSNEGAG